MGKRSLKSVAAIAATDFRERLHLVYTGLQSNAIVCSDLTKSYLTDAKDRRGRPFKKRVYPAQWKVDSKPILETAQVNPSEKQKANRLIVAIRAGNRLYGYWGNIVFAADIPNDAKTGTVSWTTTIDGTASTMVAADSRLFVGTREECNL